MPMMDWFTAATITKRRPSRDGPTARPRYWRWYRNGGHAGARGPLAEIAGSTSRGTLCWSHWRTGRKSQQTARERFAKAGNARVRRGMIQLAWRFLLSEGQCIGPVVSDTN